MAIALYRIVLALFTLSGVVIMRRTVVAESKHGERNPQISGRMSAEMDAGSA